MATGLSQSERVREDRSTQKPPSLGDLICLVISHSLEGPAYTQEEVSQEGKSALAR